MAIKCDSDDQIQRAIYYRSLLKKPSMGEHILQLNSCLHSKRKWEMAHRHTKTEFIVSGCLGTFAGVAFTAGGVLLLWSTITFLPGTVPTTGTIVSCVRIRTASCDPTVSFPLPSGQELTFQSAYASSSFQVGGTVPVRYHPKTPQDARIVSLEIWIFQLIIVGTGLLLLLVGLFHFLRGIVCRLRLREGREL
jgi:uncharacterized protein DUF3592